jgi:hypothetical protein
MEYRRRTVSNVIDNDFIDIEKQIIRKRSTSIDETLDEYTEYVYSRTFIVCNILCCGLLKLICPCSYRKRSIIDIT